MAKSPRIKATVGPFVFAYPHLTAPDSEGKYADNKYKVDGIAAPTTDAMKRAKVVIADAMKQLGSPKNANLPLKQETAKNDQGKREPTGNLMFRTKSQFPPAIVDASGKPIPDKVLKGLTIGAGSEGLLQGYFSSYELTVTERDKDGNKVTTKEPGVSFTLTGVQLIKLVKGGKGTADFAAYEGGGFSIDDEDTGDVNDLGLDLDDAEDTPPFDEGDGGILDI
jgi:hypothetical protein